MISGTRDTSFPINDAREECRELKERAIRVKMAEVEDDHCLFLSRPQDLRNIIDTFRKGKLG